MEPEPTDPTLGTSPSLVTITWAPGDNNWSQRDNGTGNSTTWADNDRPFFNFDNIVSLVTLLVCLCGATGNGAVVWLLGFRLKRSPFSVYILNLACADGIFLLASSAQFSLFLVSSHKQLPDSLLTAVVVTSSLVGLGLLMAVSTERCVSVLCPLWYRCHCPAHLSSAVCALIWGLGLCGAICGDLCDDVHIPCASVFCIYWVTVLITFVVLCVSNLTLLVRVQCGSRGTRPSRLYVTIVVNVLAFLLLALPCTVYFFVLNLSSVPVYSIDLSPILELLLFLNSAVNPVIYFFVGRYRQRPGRTPLREVLQRALRDEEEGAEV